MLQEHRELVNQWIEFNSGDLSTPLEMDNDITTKGETEDIFMYLSRLEEEENKAINKAIKKIGLKVPKIKKNESPEEFQKRADKVRLLGIQSLKGWVPSSVGITSISDSTYKIAEPTKLTIAAPEKPFISKISKKTKRDLNYIYN